MHKVIAPFLIILVAGCATNFDPKTPRERLVTASEEFRVVVNTLDRLRVSGVIEDGSEVEAQAQAYVKKIDSALAAAEKAVLAENGDEFDTYMLAVQRTLLKLQQMIANQQQENTNALRRSDPAPSIRDASAYERQNVLRRVRSDHGGLGSFYQAGAL